MFFTGERGVGKSTLLNRLLAKRQLTIDGFRTLPFVHPGGGKGFYLAANEEVPLANPGPDRIIARRAADGRIEERFPHVFDTVGVRILSRCLNNPPDLIVMDELGFLENQALQFQHWVFRCLEAPVSVLGVIKPRSTPFLDRIRQRQDVTVCPVTVANREQLYRQLAAKFSNPNHDFYLPTASAGPQPRP